MVPPPRGVGGRGTTTFYDAELCNVISICMFVICDEHTCFSQSEFQNDARLNFYSHEFCMLAPAHLPICKPSPVAHTNPCWCSLSATGNT